MAGVELESRQLPKHLSTSSALASLKNIWGAFYLLHFLEILFPRAGELVCLGLLSPPGHLYQLAACVNSQPLSLPSLSIAPHPPFPLSPAQTSSRCAVILAILSTHFRSILVPLPVALPPLSPSSHFHLPVPSFTLPFNPVNTDTSVSPPSYLASLIFNHSRSSRDPVTISSRIRASFLTTSWEILMSFSHHIFKDMGLWTYFITNTLAPLVKQQKWNWIVFFEVWNCKPKPSLLQFLQDNLIFQTRFIRNLQA